MPRELSDFGGLLDWRKLQIWIEAQNLPGTGAATQVQKLTGGSQNNLFLITRGSEHFVLRRPPQYPRPNSNEIMRREARVLRALAGTNVPHPHLYVACEDLSVLGVNFYVMSTLEGFSPINELPEAYATNRSWRRAMGFELVSAAVALAAVDYCSAGLGDFGKPDKWHGRQVSRWHSQLEGYRTLPNYQGHTLPHVDEVGRWLSEHVPNDGRIGIIHGDFQFPNAMFSLRAPRISGIIDWELATLGDPLLDLAWVLSSWWEKDDPTGKKPMVEPWDGFISRSELVHLYGEMSGRDMSAMPWFFVLACFKLACILEGTFARAAAGQAPRDTGARHHAYAEWLLIKAKRLTQNPAI